MKKLDSTSFVTLYYQLNEFIIGKIANNVWTPGDKIPSEHQLSEQFTYQNF
ncbi:GntR family transcriptional regulator [Peribacillus alkalitolerans]|uniref:GntR family transcriptional regulator n=1 Tax=Peribacillus alkalitolerans TaxID=1550385 RepID=UPI0013D166C9|nr:GntR family transcriptional regulator [Peribacillus alkalitolerans]